MHFDIFDVGLHTGQDTEHYLRRGFRVLAIEADPDLCRDASKRFRPALKSGRLHILNCGIGPVDGQLPFYVNRGLREWSSFEVEYGARDFGADEIQVEVRTMASVLGEFGTPYYMKIDIESWDRHAVASMAATECRPKYVSVENGNGPLLPLLRQAGYGAFKFINQAHFTNGSSGPFGEDTAGEWLTGDQVRREIDAYWNNPQRDAAIHGWFDLHARHGSPDEKVEPLRPMRAGYAIREFWDRIARRA